MSTNISVHCLAFAHESDDGSKSTMMPFKNIKQNAYKPFRMISFADPLS